MSTNAATGPLGLSFVPDGRIVAAHELSFFSGALERWDFYLQAMKDDEFDEAFNPYSFFKDVRITSYQNIATFFEKSDQYLKKDSQTLPAQKTRNQERVFRVLNESTCALVHLFASNNDLPFLEFLVQEKKEEVLALRDHSNRLPLEFATQPKVISYLLEHTPNLEIHEVESLASNAVRDKDTFRFKAFLNWPRFTQDNCAELMLWAIYHNFHSGIKVLTERGFDLSGQYSIQPYSLCIKQFSQQLEADPVKSEGGLTPLHMAALEVRPSMIQHLVRQGADPNAVDEKGRTPLELFNEYETTQKRNQYWLIEADKGSAADQKTTVMALTKKVLEAVSSRGKFGLAFFKTEPPSKWSSLLNTMTQDDFKAIDPNTFFNHIGLASEEEQTRFLKNVVRYFRVDLDRLTPRDQDNHRRVFNILKESLVAKYSCPEDCSAIVIQSSLYLDEAISAERLKKFGRQIIEKAYPCLQKGHYDTLRFALEILGDIRTEVGGRTFIHYAAQNNDLPAMKFLVQERGEEVLTLRDHSNRLPLEFSDQPEAISYLLEHTPNLEVKEVELIASKKVRSKKTAGYQAFVNWSRFTQDNCAELMVWTIQRNHFDGISCLIQKGFNLNGHYRVQPLSLRAWNSDHQFEIDPAKDEGGLTPLHVAVLDYKPSMIRHLVRQGADPNAVDEKGRTLLELFNEYETTKERNQCFVEEEDRELAKSQGISIEDLTKKVLEEVSSQKA